MFPESDHTCWLQTTCSCFQNAITLVGYRSHLHVCQSVITLMGLLEHCNQDKNINMPCRRFIEGNQAVWVNTSKHLPWNWSSRYKTQRSRDCGGDVEDSSSNRNRSSQKWTQWSCDCCGLHKIGSLPRSPRFPARPAAVPSL